MHDENKNPQKDFDEVNNKRPYIYNKLLEFARTKNFSKEFEEAYNLMINFFQYRESPKYYIIFDNCCIKNRSRISINYF